MLKQHEMLKQVVFMMLKSDLYLDASSKDLALDIFMLHKNGYLYVSVDENDIVRFVACIYRVKDIPKEYPKEYPSKSEGNILYVAWAISEDNDNKTLKRLLTSFMETNKDVKTIAFHDLKDGERLKVFNRKTEKKVVKKKATVKKRPARKKTTKKTKTIKTRVNK